MKGTKIMLAFIGTTLITWMFLSILSYLFTEHISFRQAALRDWVGVIMLVFGWIPAVIVCTDLDDKL